MSKISLSAKEPRRIEVAFVPEGATYQTRFAASIGRACNKKNVNELFELLRRARFLCPGMSANRALKWNTEFHFGMQ